METLTLTQMDDNTIITNHYVDTHSIISGMTLPHHSKRTSLNATPQIELSEETLNNIRITNGLLTGKLVRVPKWPEESEGRKLYRRIMVYWFWVTLSLALLGMIFIAVMTSLDVEETRFSEIIAWITLISSTTLPLGGFVVLIADKFFGISPEPPFNPYLGIAVETYMPLNE